MADRVMGALSSEIVVVLGLLVASGLALYWLLRGAPIGQAAEAETSEEAPRSGYRDRMAAATVLGVLGVGLGAYVAVRFGVPWSIPVFAAGFGVLIVSRWANRKDRHASPSLRRMARFADAVLNGSLLAGVLIVGNVLAFQYGGRPIDLSRDRAYTLSSLTINQLRDLEEPVTFTVYFGSGEQALGQLDRLRQLLRLIEAENPDRIEVAYLDPFAEPVRARELAEQVPGLQMTEGGGVVVSYGTGEKADRIIVRNAEMFAVVSPEQPGSGVLETRFLGEAALTTALIRLKQGDRPVVAITTGHGEPSITAMQPTRPGLGQLRARLDAVGMEVVPYNPIEPVPENTSVVLVAAPEDPLGPQAVSHLTAFASRGGPILLMLDNRLKTGLEDWMAGLGVTVGEGVVVDPSLSYQQPFFPFIPIGGGGALHPIVEPLDGRMILMPNASPLDLSTGPSSPSRSVVMPLLRSSPRSWVETDPEAGQPRRDPQTDLLGPIVVAAAVSDRPDPVNSDGIDEPTPKLVVLSSRYVADNTIVAASPANLDLIVNALSWLQRRPDLVGIAPRTYVARQLKATPNLRVKLVLLPTMMAVSVLIGLGMATYLSRRE